MVALSLYRGNLHRLPPNVSRRWLMPTPAISLKDFRSLLFRRSKALSLLPSSSSSVATNSTAVVNPNPNFTQFDLKSPENPNSIAEPSNNVEITMEDAGDSAPLDHPPLLDDVDVKKLVEERETEKEVAPVVDNSNIPSLEGTNKVDAIDEKEKRKREVEEKLHTLNKKKHTLVQALKQILNAEEELKRRSSIQASRPPLPLQVDASNDSGSMTRHATPRGGSDANLTADMEVGEGDDAVNHIPQPRLLRMSSTSPSAESALRRAPYFQQNTASHPSRAALVAAGSPSRFAPSGNQGHQLPSVSVSGTNYFASSPSPAASGGTSGFRDARHPSPWN